jgi:hypothetical protein
MEAASDRSARRRASSPAAHAESKLQARSTEFDLRSPFDSMYTAKGQLDVNTMLKQYSPLVRRLAHQMIAKLPANVEIDDLIQVGMIGLTDALSASTPRRACSSRPSRPSASAAPCSTSCAATTGPERGTRKQQREIESAVHKLEQRLGRAPARGEIAREMGVHAGRVPGAARQGARHPAGLPGRHVGRRRRRRLPRPPRGRRRPATRWRSCRTTACARRWSRRSRTCPSASST